MRLKLFIRYYLLSFLLFLFILFITLIVFFEIRERANERSEELFKSRVTQAQDAIERRMRHYIQILRGGKGLFIASDSVTRSDWKIYIETLNVDESYPGIQGIGFSKYIRAGELDQHIRQIRADGFPDYYIKPEGKRPDYTSIIYLEPFNTRNQRAFGFDMFSEPVRRKAMENARDSGKPAISGKVTLVQEMGKDVQPGFVLYLPLYKNRETPQTTDDRRKSLKGFVYSPFRAGDLMKYIFRNEYSNIDIEIYDGATISKESMLYNSDTILHYFKSEKNKVHDKLISQPIAGHRWSIYFSSLPTFNPSSEDSLAYTVLFGGIIISLLVFSVIYFISNARRSQEEANERIRENSRLLQKVFQEAPAIVGILRAPDQVYILANPLLSKLYHNRQLLGKSAREAHSDHEGQGFFELLDDVFRTGKPFIGKEMPATINRENGTNSVIEYFNVVYQPLLDENGKVEAVLLFAVDVTEIVTGRQKLASINKELTNKNEQLTRTNNDLDNFIYTASHDLKAPISNIEGLINALKSSDTTKDEDTRFLIEMMTSSVERFKNTIIDLTEITKAQKSSEDVLEEIYFSKIFEEIKSSIHDLITISGAKIDADFSKYPSIRFSRKNLRSILYNLISNAIKYRSPERQPEIQIRTQNADKYILLIVKDNGLGINERQKEKIFSMFSRLHDHVAGTGIGLYLVKRIIDNNGGKIELDSSEGQGSEFKVYLRENNS